MRVANHLLEFRAQQLHELESACGCGKQLGDVTTVNLTGLEVPLLGATLLFLRSASVPSRILLPAARPTHFFFFVGFNQAGVPGPAGTDIKWAINVIPTVAEAG